MFSVSLHYGDTATPLSPILHILAAWKDPDMTPLLERLVTVMFDENRKARLAKIDKYGKELEPIVEATVKRRRRAGKGDGPPLIPDREGSRLIADASVTAGMTGPDSAQVILCWPTTEPWLVTHRTVCNSRNGVRFKSGAERPIRDVVGMHAEWVEEVEKAVEEEVVRMFGVDAVVGVKGGGEPAGFFEGMLGI
jgi:hypothetical protein